jgi:hypothetical protein
VTVSVPSVASPASPSTKVSAARSSPTSDTAGASLVPLMVMVTFWVSVAPEESVTVMV